MILLKFIAMRKDHWEQMYTHLKKEILNGNKEEATWVHRKNTK